MSDKKYPSNLYLESVTTSVDFASHVSVSAVIVMAKELLELRKIQDFPAELPCNVKVGATTFREGVKTINLLKAIHRRSLNP